MTKPDKAEKLFKSGYNCAQAVLCAFAEDFGIDETTAAKLAEGLGGGMGRMRLTCGAVSAMAVCAGLMLSRGEAGDTETRQKVYALTRKMAAEFKEKKGSIICGELLGAALPKDSGPAPEKRTAEYYKKRPCAEYVRCCAEILSKEAAGL